MRYWPFATQIGLWIFLAGMAWNAHKQMEAQIESIERRMSDRDRTDALKTELLIRVDEQVKNLVSEVQLLRRRLEDKKIVFQAGSDNSGVVGGKYNERP